MIVIKNVLQLQHHDKIDEFLIMQGKKMFDRIFQSIEEAFIILQIASDSSLRYVYANKQAIKKNHIIEENIGKYIKDVEEPHKMEELSQMMQEIIQNDIKYPTTFTPRDDASNLLLIPITNEENELVYSVIVIQELQDSAYFDNCKQKLLEEIIIQYAQTMDMIENMLYRDLLTGLYNRKALFKHLDKAIQRAQESSEEISILYIDLDRFKLFNDTLGYQMGDQLLVDVGKRLSGIDHSAYSVYRISGDNYVILLPHVNQEQATIFASQVMDRFNDPFEMNGQDYFMTPSMGIALYPLDGLDSDSLIRKADAALYQVKISGRGEFQFYSIDLYEQLPNVLQMEAKLRRALEKDELSIYLQPQINLESGRVTSFEALLRWNNAELGFISPAEFIPIAEETGLIIPIGEWVIEEVCKLIRSWNEKGYEPVKVAVNLSPRQFLQPTLGDVIHSLLHKYDIEPSLLEIEITESAMQDTSEALNVLNRLNCLGVSISVDDFGTGYSSLSYLKQFPLNTLKIDRSFIQEVLSDRKDAAIITTIIYLAHSLGLEVIAEGVETEEQAQFLRDVRCEKAQGFYYSKPLPIEEIEKLFF